MLGILVDGQQTRVAAHRADHDVTVVEGHPDVEVGQSSGQLRHAPRPPRQGGEAVEVGVAQDYLSSNAATTSGSMVCFGPVNQCLTDTCQ
jgi:hypothetical protein